ncbi:hypothetical protein JG687_00015836 [Phytophthora cactorum]|uniref:Uncharacterized protein n=1 Tax=Phytophthora cactorum TaxID=29920 RepID=A0A8T1TS92_9STRA|nr:hypothetical protein GQ600_8798 [Phytophthora cactorum]KAG6947857.1 hypothetical protein JG687_00015836 [Phytophthora cactorum]
MFLGVLPDLPIRDVTANNRQRRKNELKWASALQEIRASRRNSDVACGGAATNVESDPRPPCFLVPSGRGQESRRALHRAE